MRIGISSAGLEKVEEEEEQEMDPLLSLSTSSGSAAINPAECSNLFFARETPRRAGRPGAAAGTVPFRPGSTLVIQSLSSVHPMG